MIFTVHVFWEQIHQEMSQLVKILETLRRKISDLSLKNNLMLT